MAYGQSILAMHDALDAKQAEIDRLVTALDSMRFAYVNTEPEFPHSFEEEAYKEATALLGQHGKPFFTWSQLMTLRGVDWPEEEHNGEV